MAQREIKKCRDCGAAFEASRNDYTVRCRECRAERRHAHHGGSSSEPQHRETFHECKTCGRTFPRGEALKHRRETGHSF